MSTAKTDPPIPARTASRHSVTRSPFGADDEIGMLNLMTPQSRAAALADVDATRTFDLSVDLFVGMPTFSGYGDPGFQIWMSHTPAGTIIDNPAGLGPEHHRLVGWSADCITMFTHSGTHLDTLNHFGYCGEIWNGFNEREHLASRHWAVCGAEKVPPIVARGVLIDVPGALGMDVLPDSYGVGAEDLQSTLDRQGTEMQLGDVVLIRTGRMQAWPDPGRYLPNEPGLNREGAQLLAESGAMVIGADNVALEQLPSAEPDNWHPVHTYLLAEAGVPIMENVQLEGLAAARVYQFAVIATPMPIRGATGAPMRPVAMPLRER